MPYDGVSLTFRLVYVCIKWCRDVLEDLRVNRYRNLADPGLGKFRDLDLTGVPEFALVGSLELFQSQPPLAALALRRGSQAREDVLDVVLAARAKDGGDARGEHVGRGGGHRDRSDAIRWYSGVQSFAEALVDGGSSDGGHEQLNVGQERVLEVGDDGMDLGEFLQEPAESLEEVLGHGLPSDVVPIGSVEHHGERAL